MGTNKRDFKKDDLVYTVKNLAVEPLIAKWYAWAHLLSPQTAAMNIKNRHINIMTSYIQNPMVHAAAIKNPNMLGGPFIDYEGKRVDEIKSLKEETEKECSDLLELCGYINEIFHLLYKEAKGYSLNDLYDKIPNDLKGLIEIYYDLNNNPSFRFFEPLLYRTKYYKESLQSINLLKIFDDESRSFVLSTPRLPDSRVINKKIPFNSEQIDQLFRGSDFPVEYGQMVDLFNINEEEEEVFKTFFTKTPKKNYKRYSGDGALTRYFGHACILVETKDTSILVDPVISYGYESDISRYTYSDLPDKINYVLITHNHQDHVLFETLLRIRHKVDHVIVPRNNGGELQDPNLKLVFEKLGFQNVIELEEMETLYFKDCSITGIPFLGEHSDLNIRTKLCHLVSFKNNFKMLFAADSCNHEPQLYGRVKDIIGLIDVVFLGMECDGAPLSWLYGPLMPKQLDRDKDQTRRLAGSDFNQAKAIVDIFRPKNLFVYAMGLEPWLRYISSIKYTDQSKPIIESNNLLGYCESIGIDAERLYGEKIIEYNTNHKSL